jgi:hypothetical protein
VEWIGELGLVGWGLGAWGMAGKGVAQVKAWRSSR